MMQTVISAQTTKPLSNSQSNCLLQHCWKKDVCAVDFITAIACTSIRYSHNHTTTLTSRRSHSGAALNNASRDNTLVLRTEKKWNYEFFSRFPKNLLSTPSEFKNEDNFIIISHVHHHLIIIIITSSAVTVTVNITSTALLFLLLSMSSVALLSALLLRLLQLKQPTRSWSANLVLNAFGDIRIKCSSLATIFLLSARVEYSCNVINIGRISVCRRCGLSGTRDIDWN